MTTRRRLDQEMVRRELVPSRTEAQRAIAAGQVTVGGAPASRPAHLVSAGEPIRLIEVPRFVGRGGEKLDPVLDRFGMEVGGRRAVDVGASTGGFTDCLLQRGAAAVVAVDVGHGQLHERLRRHPAVTVVERCNIRTADPAALGAPFDLVVADLSFISLRVVARQLAALLGPAGDMVVLVKPQFEVGRVEVSRGRGVVADPGSWSGALGGVTDALRAAGLVVRGCCPSPIRGGRGNVEFFLWSTRHPGAAVTPGASEDAPAREVDRAMIDGAVAEAVRTWSVEGS